jgi:hypothetical protein
MFDSLNVVFIPSYRVCQGFLFTLKEGKYNATDD